MRNFFITGLLFFLSCASELFPLGDSTITINEIMFHGVSGNNEFIEIYNLSYQPVDLNGYTIKYNTSNFDRILTAGFGTVIEARGYAVIFEGDYSLDSGMYKGLVPASALILKISDNAFGTNGMSNTEDRPVYLYSPGGAPVDSYYYSANNSPGISDEKINLFHAQYPGNWMNARYFPGSPGGQNTVFPLNYDGEITSFVITPNPAFPNEQLTLRTTVKNSGLGDMDQTVLNIYRDLNGDSTVSQNELISVNFVQFLATGDSEEIENLFFPMPPGKNLLIGVLEYPDDEYLANNIAYTTLNVIQLTTGFNEVVFNEIMYAPTVDDPEWIELYNTGNSTKNLKRWRISDKTTTVNLPDRDILIPPKGYLVIADDSSFFRYFPNAANVLVLNLPSLNNEGDALSLRDTLNFKVDSMIYRPWWGGRDGRSLERIKPSVSSLDTTNWKSSRIGSTPGYINTASPKVNDIFLTGTQVTPEFPSVAGTVSLRVFFRNNGTLDAEFNLFIYKDVNRDSVPDQLIAQSPLLTLNTGDSSSYYFLNLLPFINTETYLFVKAIQPGDEDTTNNLLFRRITLHPAEASVVINEIMYAPYGGAPEWIEIFNNQGNLLNLRKWKISDGNTTVSLPDRDIFLPLLGYVVIADDSSFFQYYSGTSAVIISPLPSLNNDGDVITIKDPSGAPLDSIRYFASWGGSGGRSLERIDAEWSTNDSLNWKTSRISATPGFVNTASQKAFDADVNLVEFAPFYPVAGDDINVTVYPVNRGIGPIMMMIYVYLDTNNDSIPDTELARSSMLQVDGLDSTEYGFPRLIRAIDSDKHIIVRVDALNDQDTTNNTAYVHIRVYTPAAAVKISEIMYSPVNGMPEWIELYNSSSSDVDLSGWKVMDYITTPSTAVIPEGTKIKAKSYIVIADDSVLINYFRKKDFPMVTLNLPPLNNDQDGVLLMDNYNRRIDSALYSQASGGKNGYSLEKTVPSSPVLTSVWKECIDTEKGTPARINSTTPRVKDFKIKSVSLIPAYPELNTEIRLKIVTTENGSGVSGAVALKIYIDSVSSGRFLDSASVSISSPGDSFIVITKSFTFNGPFTAIVRSDTAGDEDRYNSDVAQLFIPGFAERTVLISEVMYNPAAGEKEWIELYNASDKPADLKNWTLNFTAISDTTILIPSGGYLVAASDTALYSRYGRNIRAIKLPVSGLSAGETILLKDNRGALIDTFAIKSFSSYYRNHSLEKTVDGSGLIHPSTDPWKATPGIPNSLIHYSDPSGAVVVNEIMFDTDSNFPEYIEIYNGSSDTLNSAQLKIRINENESVPLSIVNRALLPGDYAVVASDSSVFNQFDMSGAANAFVAGGGLSLPNGGAAVRVLGLSGVISDSAFYFPDWYGKYAGPVKNKSLERINPALPANEKNNWAGSADRTGGTPGRLNSMFTLFTNPGSSLSVSPNPFSPDNDGYEDNTVISYNLASASNLITIRVYDGSGRLIRTVAENQGSAGSGSIGFDGRDDSGRPLPIGIYIIYLEARGAQSGAVQKLKTVVVSARKL